ncbi:MAG TPA: hypothetical protein VFV93_05375 [Thermomicrobiales bacterium]|nr:hypothetical protein [Thermomicrobiales bacterium]
MLVMVKCMIFEGSGELPAAGTAAPRITHVREGQVLGAWRATEGRVGYALLDITSMAMVATLLKHAFPTARHIDVDEILAVEPSPAAGAQRRDRSSSGDSRQTGT